MAIHDGQLEQFKRLIEECLEVVRSLDSGTLEYNFYLNADGTECFVHERYRDSAAGLEHVRNIESVARRLADVCTISGEVCGTPNEELRTALESAGVRIYEPVSLP